MAWAHGTLGIADACAPSWTGFKDRDAAYLNRWLEQGFAVVATDYQGLGGPGPHPYSDWRAEGRSVLDSVRAAQTYEPGLIANAVLLAGQSQGSGAALGAGRLAAQYAPELNILGVVSTGLNSTFPQGPVKMPVRSSPNTFLSLASGGLRDDGPTIETIVTPAGRQILDKARQACTHEIGLLARELKIGSMTDALAIAPEALQAIRIIPTDMPMEPVGLPILVATGMGDATIAPERQYAAVSALCAVDDKVVWRTYEGLGHDGALHGSFEDALAFARARLRGETPQSTCGQAQRPGPPGALDPKAPFNKD